MIDPRADIHPTAKIADQVTIGPWSIIGPHVEIGAHSWIGPHVVISGHTKIGCENRIFQYASIGEIPQDKKYQGEETYLEIGHHNTIREYCTINRGTQQGGGFTRIGDDNWFMAYVHVAHDCQVKAHTVFANNASIAGHVTVEDYAILSPFSGVHQFCTIGSHSFVAKASYVTKDVLPYVLVEGYSPVARSINTEGLRRRGFSSKTIDHLRRAYKIIFRQGLTVDQALTELEVALVHCPEIGLMIQALNRSQRGIVR